MDIGLVNCNISELRLKRLYAFLFIVLVIVTSSCRPSESQIVAALAQTETIRSATYVVETQEAKILATESAVRTSAAQSTFQAATATRVHQETATRSAEETIIFESTIQAATATASSMKRQVQELVDSGILNRSDGAYFSLAPDFNNRSGVDEYPWIDTGFAPTDFVISFDVSCSYAVKDDESSFGLQFRQTNGNYYSMNIWSGRVSIMRWSVADLERLDNFEVPDDWQPGDDPIIITNIFPILGRNAFSGDGNVVRFMLVVEEDLFSIFAGGEKLFRAFDTSLDEGNLRLLGPTESECQFENMELWILD